LGLKDFEFMLNVAALKHAKKCARTFGEIDVD
jgi:hypothetical protein